LVLQVRKARAPRLDRSSGVCISTNLKWILTLQFEQSRDFFKRGGDLFFCHRCSSHPSAAPIELVTLNNTIDIVPRTREIDIATKSFLRQRGRDVIVGPALGATGAGIVFGKGKRGRVRLVIPMLKGAMEIPCPGLKVCLGIEQIIRLETRDMRFFGPFSCRTFAHLHETTLASGSNLSWIEPALTPNNGFDQHRIELVLSSDRASEVVELMETRRAEPLVSGVDGVA